MLHKNVKALTDAEMNVALGSIERWESKSTVKLEHRLTASFYLRQAARWPALEAEMELIGFLDVLKKIQRTEAGKEFETPMNIDRFFMQVQAYCGGAS